MCGITGYVDFSGQTSPEVLDAMVETLAHRGPDARGTFHTRLGNTDVALGHTRLSIIDLSEGGAQPRVSPSKEQAIVFNGEIYNFHELKHDLEDSGVRFDSNSDTEVILKSFLYSGIESVSSFVGMFAYAIVDRRQEKLWLVRDRAGVKPLYYSLRGDHFIFGSELKSLMAHPKFRKTIDPSALNRYFQYGWVPSPDTIFHGVNKVPPGHWLELDLRTQTVHLSRFWDVLDSFLQPISDISESEALSELDQILTKAFEYRMVSDVPVGVFLSGGVDSSIVAAFLQKNRTTPLSTYTIGFDDPAYDESPHARAVAEHLGTRHTEMRCSVSDALDIVADLPEIFDEPFGDPSAIPTILVSRLARQEVKVVLSADAGDEAFGGYGRYLSGLRLQSQLAGLPAWLRAGGHHLLASIPWSLRSGFSVLPTRGVLRNWHRRLGTLEGLLGASDLRRFTQTLIGSVPRKEADRLLLKSVKPDPLLHPDRKPAGDSLLRFMQFADYTTYMSDDILQKVDRSSMSVSLESREPLLDHSIIEFSASLPDHFKVRNGVEKWLLRELLYRYVPRSLVDRPKAGFTPPVAPWLRNELRGLMEDLLSPSLVKQHGLLSPGAVNRLKQSFLSGANLDASRIWRVVAFQMWAKRWL